MSNKYLYSESSKDIYIVVKILKKNTEILRAYRKRESAEEYVRFLENSETNKKVYYFVVNTPLFGTSRTPNPDYSDDDELIG